GAASIEQRDGVLAPLPPDAGEPRRGGFDDAEFARGGVRAGNEAPPIGEPGGVADHRDQGRAAVARRRTRRAPVRRTRDRRRGRRWCEEDRPPTEARQREVHLLLERRRRGGGDR